MTYDQTYLRANREGYRVHRDYAAHYFRWGWAVSRHGLGLAGKTVLDVGCGPDLPILRVATYKSQQPVRYVGVDLNNLPELPDSQARWAELHAKTDFNLWAASCTERFDRIICFEVLEHESVDGGWQTLWWMRQLLAPGGCILLSTPILGRAPASNHVHEYTLPELAQRIHDAGFEVEKRYGTFASEREALPALREWATRHGHQHDVLDLLWSELREFHAPEVLATFVAPVIPDASRNCVWVLRTKGDE